jgi:hypothetical protein
VTRVFPSAPSHLRPRSSWLLALAVALGAASGGLAQETATIEKGGGTLAITFAGPTTPEFRQLTLDWISRAAQAVTVYYGRYPVRRVDITVTPVAGRRVGPGRASGEGGPNIHVTVGTAATAQGLATGRDNWLVTHEMVHLALAGVEEEHHWLEEGLATYVEPIARVRAGELTARQVWGDMVEGLPQGEPAPGDLGLDHTPTWGRTYWGGALFCLLADVEIRKETHNRKGLEDALRGIVAAGGTIDQDWGIARVLKVGDAAIGLPILERQYDAMKASPAPVDLPALWKQLGVEVSPGAVVLRDDAPLAGIRQAIMRP